MSKKECAMLKVQWLEESHRGVFAPLYQDFCDHAITAYRWPQAPLGLDALYAQCHVQHLGVLLLYQESQCIGFWLYAFPPHGALELSAFYLLPTLQITASLVQDAFQLAFQAWNTLPQWQDFSFGIYGIQSTWGPFLDTCPVEGCTPIALAQQHILQRRICLADAPDILKRPNAPRFPYSIQSWKPKYQAGLAPTLAAAFQDEPDALWDARFRNEIGAQSLLQLIETHAFGRHFAPLSYVALNEARKPYPVGAIFLLQVEDDVVNIPLLFIHPEHQGKGLGRALMLHLMQASIKAVQAKQLKATFINVTTNPVQATALKVYKALDFVCQDEGFHAYTSRKS
jgi:GNAT superfamily N-acetyltransferase